MTKGQRARLFAALELPGEVTTELAAWARAALPRRGGGPAGDRLAAAGVRLLGEDLMHVTLCFLGARPVAEVDALADAVLATEPAAIELTLGAPVWLPPRRPRALAVEVSDGDGGLADLQEQLVAALAGASTWEPERRRFRAHVTVARLRGRGEHRPAPPVSLAAELPATPALRFAPAALALYRSWLSPSGASYEQLAAVDLG